ncbi:phosphocholine-specific phospholipase C [Solimonas marina]|uniref:phospholipase C n=1 Tax=Solimonas marina TaxID=2714601 RepID=A0A969WAU5_9GAMM|nr:phospholipase C, phosphocholine-specific [Solimonas marina]NKF23114.1 phospholipase C, phosphocholine-specific [Solimonas marina]
MNGIDRRRFLKLAGGATAAAALPASIRRALAIPANNRSGTINDVEHVVILMQENRAFDHYLGTLPGVRGFGDRFTIPLPDGRSVWQQQYESDGATRLIQPYHLDQTQGNAQRVDGTPHGWADAHGAWDRGRLSRWPTYKKPQSMGHYSEAELPFQFALANAFTVCDAYFCAIHSSTNPNRIFHWTGSNDPRGTHGGPAIDNTWDGLAASTEGYTWTTYPERLEAAGVSWKLYQNLPNNFTDNPLAGFVPYRQANEAHGNNADGSPYPAYQDADNVGNPLYKGIANTLPGGNVANPNMLAQFRADIAAGALPQVTWIVAPDAYSEHPGPSSPVQGAWYTQQVLDALTADPELWSKTALIVNFDENDGFFDHVPPPCAPSLDDNGTRLGGATIAIDGETHSDGLIYGPGPRVPMYVISPWSRGGWVCSETFSHTSVLRFLEKRFGVAEPNQSPWRRAVCGDLTSAFNFVNPNDEALPSLPARSKLESDALRYAQELRPQVAVPDEAVQQAPTQQRLARPSRALPYELHATSRVDTGTNTLKLLFANSGSAAAVFHAYDRLHLEAPPRRYGLAPGTALEAEWSLAADNGQYDLWLLGPNGWHRHFTGLRTTASGADPEIRICYDVEQGGVHLDLRNHGDSACRFIVTPNAYFDDAPATIEVAAGDSGTWRRELTDSFRWYDFTVTLEDDSRFSRRFAGRVETGEPSVSDPEMGQASGGS